MTVIKSILLIGLGIALSLGLIFGFDLEVNKGISLDPTMYPYPTHLWKDGSFHIVVGTGSIRGCLPWGSCDFGYRNRGIFRPVNQMECIGIDCLS